MNIHTGTHEADAFSGFAFTLGSVYGTRSFKFNETAGGVIESPMFTNYRWLEKRYIEAECQASGWICDIDDADHKHRLGQCLYVPSLCTYHGRLTPCLDCTCGFYAYFNGTLGGGYAAKSQLAGVVEAFGRVIIGTRGFRAQKARIVALYAPNRQSPRALGLTVSEAELLRVNYPSLPLYDSFEQMVSDFPTDNPVGGR